MIFPTLNQLRRFIANPDAFLGEIDKFLIAQGARLYQTASGAHDMTSELSWMGQDKDAFMHRLAVAVTGSDFKQQESISGASFLRDKIGTMCSLAGDVVHLVDDPANKELKVLDDDEVWNVVPRHPSRDPVTAAAQNAAAKALQAQLISGVTTFVTYVADSGAEFSGKGTELSQVNLPGVKAPANIDDPTKLLAVFAGGCIPAALLASPSLLGALGACVVSGSSADLGYEIGATITGSPS